MNEDVDLAHERFGCRELLEKARDNQCNGLHHENAGADEIEKRFRWFWPLSM